MQFDRRADVIDVVLFELEHLAAWEDDGEPKFVPPLSADEQRFWQKAKDRGIDIPEEIEAQL